MMQRCPNLLLVFLLAASGLLLAGCFQSEQPKFSLAGAAAPFGDGGRHVVYEWVAGDRFDRQEVFVIRRRPDRSYEFMNEKGQSAAMSLHALGGGLFVGQARPSKDRPGYGYVVFRMTDNEAVLYLPQCDKQDKTMLSTAGVEVSGRFECIIDRVADPTALFKQLELGNPVSKLVRE